MSFFIVVTLLMLRHEMWRDEMEAWLAARDSGTPIEVVQNTRYTGHPVTWYLLLHAITRITHDPRAMQLLHACLATVAVHLFARFAPFSRAQRILFCFGYFPLFEYGVISREYVLGVIALFGFCAAYAARAHIVVLALLAGLLAQTSAYGLIMSIALAAMMLFDWRSRRELTGGRTPVAAAAATGVFAVAVALSILQLIPPGDSGIVVGWQFDNRLAEFPFSIVWRALVPIPPLDVQFWNENFAGENDRLGPLALVLLPLALWMLRRDRAALVLFGVGTFGFLMFGFIKFYGSVRHHGHVYLLLIAAVWIAAARPWRGRTDPSFGSEPKHRLGKGLNIALTTLLIVHVVPAVIACGIDWHHPFSQSRAAAEFIRDRGLANAFLIGEKDTSAAGIAAYLDRRIYFPRGDRIGSYIIYDRRRLAFDPADVIRVSRAKARALGRDVVLISTTPLRVTPPSIKPLEEFRFSIAADENFWLYRVTP